MTRYKVTVPKRVLAKHTTGRWLRNALPRLVKRFGRITVTNAKTAPPIPHAITRAHIVAYCRWAIEHEPQIHYAQVRPIPLHAPRHLPLRTDCSGLATLAYRAAGAPDPNGARFDGSGDTGTMLKHGRSVPKAHALAGDLVIFGVWPGHHVCILMEDGTANGGDPLLCSHGQERGPLLTRLSLEQRYQPKPATFRTYL